MEMFIVRNVFSVLLLSFFTLTAICESATLDHLQDRFEMVRTQIKHRGVTHTPTLNALRTVPRHEFVPGEMAPFAYQDRPLPIGHGQTISQPYIVAYMTEQLNPRRTHRVLEVGTGSGYQAAVLAKIVSRVYSVEIIQELAELAEKRLAANYPNVTVINADGYHGWQEGAPYDAIIVTAAAEFIPPPLINQLKEGGKMIIPLGSPYGMQWLVLITKEKGVVKSRRLLPVQFVPFTRGR
jgi:protein-L-isoaspartate(D-aspartate) O-methyltransferase